MIASCRLGDDADALDEKPCDWTDDRFFMVMMAIGIRGLDNSTGNALRKGCLRGSLNAKLGRAQRVRLSPTCGHPSGHHLPPFAPCPDMACPPNDTFPTGVGRSQPASARRNKISQSG